MRLQTCWRLPAWVCCVLLASSLHPLLAQGSGALLLGQIQPVTAKRGTVFTQKTPLYLKSGFHVNSNAPKDEYLIPLKLTWLPGVAQAEQTIYPQPQFEHYPFSEKPVSVFSGTFMVETRFKTPPDAKPGPATINGKLRYQACNDHECLSPKTIEIQVPLDLQ